MRWISGQLKLLAGKYQDFPFVNCTQLKIGVAPSVGSMARLVMRYEIRIKQYVSKYKEIIIIMFT